MRAFGHWRKVCPKETSIGNRVTTTMKLKVMFLTSGGSVIVDCRTFGPIHNSNYD